MTFELLCMSLIALLIGLALAFWGYKLFLVLLPLWGFFFGFGLGAQTMTAIFGQGFLATTTSWVVGFIVGLIFGALSYLFYIVGVAIFAGSFGYALGIGIMAAIGFEGVLAWVIGIVLAVVVAAVVLIFNVQKYAIVLITAASGAAVAIAGLLFPFGVFTVEDLATGAPIKNVITTAPIMLVLWLILAVVAVVMQLRTTRNYEITPPENAF